MIVADFATIPLGSGTSASHYVKAVHELLRQSGIKYAAGPMSTAIEASSFEQLFEVIEKANKKLAEMGVQRIITSVQIDYRLDKDVSIESKLGILQ
ncbi:MAG: MTH1187 family thiamine-binding protein [Methanotrichaceae archaeon]|nr:MTH1187 family thiamine-binding protein [Methanotrichaceae archaeon]